MLLTVHLLAVMYFHAMLSLSNVSMALDWLKAKGGSAMRKPFAAHTVMRPLVCRVDRAARGRDAEGQK